LHGEVGGGVIDDGSVGLGLEPQRGQARLGSAKVLI